MENRCLRSPSPRASEGPPSPRRALDRFMDDVTVAQLRALCATFPPPQRLDRTSFIETVTTVTSATSEVAGEFFDRACGGNDTVGWDDVVATASAHTDYSQNVAAPLAVTTAPLRRTSASGEKPITSIVVHGRSGTIFTGSQAGLVKAWDSEMSKDRVVVDIGSWIVGMKLIRSDTRLLICALDIAVVVVETRSLDVLRGYRGRIVIGLSIGSSFLKDTTRTLDLFIEVPQIGGMPIVALKDSPRRLYRRDRHVRRNVGMSALAGLVDAPTCFEWFTREASTDDVVLFGFRDGTAMSFVLSNARMIEPWWKATLHGDQITDMLHTSRAAVSGSDDGSVKILHPTSLAVMRTLAIGARIMRIALNSPREFVIVTADRAASVWDVQCDVPLHEYNDPTLPIVNVAVDRDRNRLVLAVGDGTLRVMRGDVKDHCEQVIRASHTGMEPIAVDSPRRRIICGRTSLEAWAVVSATDGFPVSYRGPVSPIIAVVSSADGFIITLDRAAVSVWGLDGERVLRFKSTPFQRQHTLLCASWSGEGHLLMGYNTGTSVVMSADHGQVVHELCDARWLMSTVATEVTAVCSFRRRHSILYAMAIGGTIFVTDDVRQYAITTMKHWAIPEVHGVVSTMTIASPYLLAVGCSGGAVLLYSIGLCNLEGEPLLRPRYSASPSGIFTLGDPTPPTVAPPSATAGRDDGGRVVLMSMMAPWPLILVAYADGCVALWHLPTRAWVLGADFFHGVTASICIAAIEPHEKRILAHADDRENIAVWVFSLDGATTPALSPAATPTMAALPTDAWVRMRRVEMFRVVELPIVALDVTLTRHAVVTYTVTVAFQDFSVRVYAEGGVLMGCLGFNTWNIAEPSTWRGAASRPPTKLCGEVALEFAAPLVPHRHVTTASVETPSPQPPTSTPRGAKRRLSTRLVLSSGRPLVSHRSILKSRDILTEGTLTEASSDGRSRDQPEDSDIDDTLHPMLSMAPTAMASEGGMQRIFSRLRRYNAPVELIRENAPTHEFPTHERPSTESGRGKVSKGGVYAKLITPPLNIEFPPPSSAIPRLRRRSMRAPSPKVSSARTVSPSTRRVLATRPL